MVRAHILHIVAFQLECSAFLYIILQELYLVFTRSHRAIADFQSTNDDADNGSSNAGSRSLPRLSRGLLFGHSHGARLALPTFTTTTCRLVAISATQQRLIFRLSSWLRSIRRFPRSLQDEN